MHYENRLFWKRCSQKYPRYFNDPSKAAEFGSLNINGSVREWSRCSDYTSIDWREGPCVDFVSLAHEVPFIPETFDTVVSASMLEHDPYWKQSVAKMVEVLKPDGLLAISWGAALNTPHEFATAPDGEFHALKAGHVLSVLNDLGLYIHEFQYERSITEGVMDDPLFTVHRLKDPMYGMGTVVLVAFKDKKYATGERLFDPIQEWDMS